LVAVKPVRAEVKVGQSLPFTVEFTNQSRDPIIVAIPWDGSDVGWRQASYEWSVVDAAGKPVRRNRTARCGNTDPLRPDDFVTVPPRGVARVDTFFLPPPVEGAALGTGAYRVTLTYSFDPARREKGGPLGRDSSEVPGLLRRTWVGTVFSEPVTFRIVP
jgi:hypothetical protein